MYINNGILELISLKVLANIYFLAVDIDNFRIIVLIDYIISSLIY